MDELTLLANALIALDDIAVAVEHFADDIRLKHIATVDDRGDRPHQLHGRDLKGLAKGR